MEADQGVEHRLVGVRRRGTMVVHVAGQQDGVDTLLHGDPDDLVEGLAELVDPGPPPDRPPHVPVARVQQAHGQRVLHPGPANHIRVIRGQAGVIRRGWEGAGGLNVGPRTVGVSATTRPDWPSGADPASAGLPRPSR